MIAGGREMWATRALSCAYAVDNESAVSSSGAANSRAPGCLSVRVSAARDFLFVSVRDSVGRLSMATGLVLLSRVFATLASSITHVGARRGAVKAFSSRTTSGTLAACVLDLSVREAGGGVRGDHRRRHPSPSSDSARARVLHFATPCLLVSIQSHFAITRWWSDH